MSEVVFNGGAMSLGYYYMLVNQANPTPISPEKPVPSTQSPQAVPSAGDMH